MSGKETPVPVFYSSIFSFRQNQPIKFEVSMVLPAPRKLTHLFQADLEIPIQLLHLTAMKILGENWFLAPNSVQKKLINFFGVSEKFEISNFIGLFFVKGKLVELKTVTGLFFCDTEGI